MIKVDSGRVEIKGNKPIIMTDMSVIFKALLENEHLSEDEILEALKLAKMPEKDLQELAFKKFMDVMLDIMKKVGEDK